MSENIVEDMRENVENQEENVEEDGVSKEDSSKSELSDFDVDDFTQFMEGVERPELDFDEYISRDAREDVKVGNQTRKKVRIEGDLYPYFYRGLINELHRGDAPIVFIHGKRRSGKSIALAKLLHDLTDEIGCLGGSFDPKEQITYSVESFLHFHVNNVRRGLCMEEAGQNLNSKQWYSVFNRSAYEAFEVLGVMNLLTVLASTDHGDIDNDITKRDKWKIVVEKYPKFKDGECVRPPTFTVEKFEYKAGTDSRELKDGFPKHVCRYSPDLPPDEVMYDYREKELQHKYTSIKERIEEITEEKNDGENGDSDKLTL